MTFGTASLDTDNIQSIYQYGFLYVTYREYLCYVEEGYYNFNL